MKSSRSLWRPALLLATSLFWPGALAAQFSDPPAPAAYALQNVTVVQADGTRMDSVTLVIRRGLIVAMSRGAEVPADAELLEGDSLFVYPGLVDAQGEADYEFPEIEIDRSEFGSWDPPRYAQSFMPSRLVVNHLTATGEDVGDQRRSGVVAAALVPGERLMPGSGTALVFRTDAESPAQLVAKPVTGPAMYFRGAQGGYPGTLFAVIAFYRQTFEDARHHQTHVEAFQRGAQGVMPPTNDPDLDIMIGLMNGSQPAYFGVDLARDIQRVLALAREYGFRPVIVGGEEAWKVADELKAANVPVLVSLDFPEPERWKPEEEGTNGDDELDAATWREKQRLEEIYSNAGRLTAAGVTIALTSGGGDADLLEGARKAIEYGLSEAAALRALTTTPAGMFGLERLIRIEGGRPATFIVASGPLFAEDTEIRYTFVEGGLEKGKEKRGAGGDAPAVDVTGTWDITIDAEGQSIAAKMTVTQDGADFDGSMTTPFGEAKVQDGVVSGSSISFSIIFQMGGESMEVTAEGSVEGDEASGSGESPDGSFTWQAKRTAGGPGEEMGR
ncbi:MAG TPA: hypothetical protein VLC48_08465 [Gemmatimonadota bacterium]|nr:hypothetical protein [Gemmatimonadota bacterium]